MFILQEKSQLKDDQKVATSFWERERIQQRLKEVDRTIQSCKSEVHYWEGAANRDGEELKQLESTIKEEGLFCVEWCLVLSVRTISYVGSVIRNYKL